MGGIADKSTLWMPWREALKRAGSFDALQPHLHLGRIPVRHGGLYSWPDAQPRSGPGDVKPEWWAHAYVQAGRVIFITEPVVSGYAVTHEQVFAYAVSVELGHPAVDALFPVVTADLPPAELGPADWFRGAIKAHPRRPNERVSDYATRLLGLMKTAPVTRQWKYTTMYRRLYVK
jgi:hypothetical protein